MPEGDTIFRAARTLHRALSGLIVTAFDTQLSQLAIVDRRSPLSGRTILAAAARGKHLLIDFTGDLVLRTHMRMHGSWHIYRPGERWRAPRRDARVVITTERWIAIAFAVSDAEFLNADDVAHHRRLSALGPDLLSDAFDPENARLRIRTAPSKHIAEAILRQQSMAGLGNVFKSEVLFICGVYPFTPVPDVSETQLDCILDRSQKLIRLNVAEQSLAGGSHVGRVTSGRLNPREKLWVYGRTGELCLKCGTPIQSASETEGRRTYWCPRCQAATS